MPWAGRDLKDHIVLTSLTLFTRPSCSDTWKFSSSLGFDIRIDDTEHLKLVHT